jgi:superfamily II DNA or RNA helicase
MIFPPSTRVRLIGDPTKIGISTGQLRQQGNREQLLVQFMVMDQWIPLSQLEPVPSQETPLDLLKNKQFGTSNDLRRTITHVRLTGRLADVIYSMEATNTDFYAYQFKPVLKMLLSPSNSILIADEVGLGKTIEACLIWTELSCRFDMRRLLVLCPAVLRVKWQEELERRLGIRADIVDAAELLKRLKRPDNAERGFAIISSLQGLRPQKGWDNDEKKTHGHSSKLAQFLQEQENEDNLTDLLIIDEAHYLRNSETKTHQLGQLARNIAEYACFLSATPVHNKNADLFSLLHILDSDTYRNQDDFAAILKANEPLVKARDLALSAKPDFDELATLLESAQVNPLLTGNRQLSFLQAFLKSNDMSLHENRSHVAYRLETVNLLGHAVTRTRKREVNEWRVVREPIDEAICMTQEEREFYEAVTECVHDYSLNRDICAPFLLATPQRLMTSSMPAALKAWQKRLIEHDPFDDDERNEELGPLTERLASLSQELVPLKKLILNDSKYRRLTGILSDFFGEFPDEKVILFTSFRATISYLSDRLKEDGISTISLMGGGKVSKDEIIKTFADPGGPQVLLSSEVGGEGVDLQFCRVIINYDMPWNPMRVEQRIGRIDRLGQKSPKIIIWNLFYEDTIDARIYQRLYKKLDLCRSSLGDFEAILSDQIRELTLDLLRGNLTVQQQEKRIDQTALALENLRLEEERLEQGASQLLAYGDYILNQIKAARDLHRWISDEDIRSYVLDFLRLNYPGGSYKPVNRESAEYEINLTNDAKIDLEEFIKRHHLSKDTKLIRTASPAVLCRFQNKFSGTLHDRAEIISQFHPLVRFVSEQIEEGSQKLRPAVAIRLSENESLSDIVKNGTYVVAGSLWSVSGVQSSERLVFMGVCLSGQATLLNELESEKLMVTAAMDGKDWLEARTVVDIEKAYQIANHQLFAGLRQKYDDYVAEIKAQNEDRVDLQERTLRHHLHAQRQKLESIRQKHEIFNRGSLVKATEGRIRKLEDRIERKLLELEKLRNLSYRYEEVCAAIILVG